MFNCIKSHQTSLVHSGSPPPPPILGPSESSERVKHCPMFEDIRLLLATTALVYLYYSKASLSRGLLSCGIV